MMFLSLIFSKKRKEEENSEIIEDSELLCNDPVVSAVGSILSACGRLKASDILRTYGR